MSNIRILKKGVLFAIIVINSVCEAQNTSQQPISVQAKVWSKDENKQVHYSDWNSYDAITIDQLTDFKKNQSVELDKFGGMGIVIDRTGFFHTKKINDRWNVINPEGRVTYITAVNSIKVAQSSPLPSKFKTEEDWASTTFPEILDLNFNTAGCWSDVNAILSYNKSNPNRPIAYTLQLNLLSKYTSQAKKNNADRKGSSTLGFILDEEFVDYCNNATAVLLSTYNDPNLLGIFSDNELPFTNGELKELLTKKNEDDPCYQAYKKFMKTHSADEQSISEIQQKEFLAFLAEKYYSIVYASIKRADPNHMYIGSRIHSNAKNNEYLFKAATPFLDIISINYYGDWQPKRDYINNWASWSDKPFFITEFYTKAEETGMSNISGAGWIVKTNKDRAIHYQNFCIELLKSKNCVGWHWFRYQDNDPNDTKADDSNKDSNKGIVNMKYELYKDLTDKMKELNANVYGLIRYFDKK
jgi:hypothetical protein